VTFVDRWHGCPDRLHLTEHSPLVREQPCAEGTCNLREASHNSWFQGLKSIQYGQPRFSGYGLRVSGFDVLPNSFDRCHAELRRRISITNPHKLTFAGSTLRPMHLNEVWRLYARRTDSAKLSHLKQQRRHVPNGKCESKRLCSVSRFSVRELCPSAGSARIPLCESLRLCEKTASQLQRWSTS